MEKSHKVAKNTILLYIRMIISIIISLYTSRIVLAALGVDDFGIFGVIGGVVTMFMFLNNALSTSTSRFLTYALGKNNHKELNSIFNVSFIIHCVLSLIILLACETVGLWLLKDKLVIPEIRMSAAYSVFHLSIANCLISIILVPFTSLIIAHEKMGIFAYLTIFDSVLKLLIAFCIEIYGGDRLVFYAWLLFAESCLYFAFYALYCFNKFRYLSLKFVKDINLYKSMTTFTGWSLIGNIASMGYTQGLNILLNIFFGPTVNAARAISVQVESTIRNFISNFQTAINPQIIKNYAQQQLERMHDLIVSSSKFSFYLILLLGLPIMFETPFLLKLWLKEVPEYTVIFIRILLVIITMEAMSNSIMTAVVSTGKIKKYHIVVGGTLILIVPSAYYVLKFGGSPESVYYVYLIVEIIACVLRLLIVAPMIHLSKRFYVKKVVLVSAKVGFMSLLLPVIVILLMPAGIIRVLFTLVICMISTLLNIYLLGLTLDEREFVNHKIKGFIYRLHGRNAD